MGAQRLVGDAAAAARVGAWEYVRVSAHSAERRWRFNASPGLRTLFGFRDGEIEDAPEEWTSLLIDGDRHRFESTVGRCLQGLAETVDIVFQARHRDGRLVTVHARGRAELDDSGRVQRLIGMTWDISALHAEQQRTTLIARVFEASVGGLVICDAEHRILEANQTFMRMTHLSMPELRSLTLSQALFAGTDDDPLQRSWDAVRGKGIWVGHVNAHSRDGVAYRAEVRLGAADGGKPPAHYAALVVDTESLASADAHDAGGAFDASMFSTPRELHYQLMQAIKDAVGMRSGLAVFVVSIDRYSALLEAFGRNCMEQLLRECTSRLRDAVDEPVALGRLQADCLAFAVSDVLEERDVDHIFSNVTATLTRNFSIRDHTIRVSVSGGAAVFPIDGVNAEMLLQRSRSALEEARRNSRSGGRFRLYRPELSDDASDRVHTEAKLRKALKLGAFECHLQPKVRLEDGHWVGAEALIRWRIGDSWISPARFIPIAEESGLIKDIGRWVLWEAASRVAAWRSAGLIGDQFKVAVNLAGAQLESELMRTVRAVLGYTQLPSSALMLEMTETVIVENPVQARELLGELRRMGVKISLDDFGTGYTSMSQLQSLPIDEIKIDQTFIRSLPSDSSSSAIVSSIITLANGLGLDVIAEGIETETQRASLLRLGCRRGQGFLFSQALPADEFERALRTRSDVKAKEGSGPTRGSARIEPSDPR